MTTKQLFAKAKSLRATADRMESLAKKRERLDKELARLESGKAPRRAAPTVVRAMPLPRAPRGALQQRLLDLMVVKERHIDALWNIIGPEGLSANKLSMMQGIYTLAKKGLVENVSLGVWRRTQTPTHEELHGKVKAS